MSVLDADFLVLLNVPKWVADIPDIEQVYWKSIDFRRGNAMPSQACPCKEKPTPELRLVQYSNNDPGNPMAFPVKASCISTNGTQITWIRVLYTGWAKVDRIFPSLSILEKLLRLRLARHRYIQPQVLSC